ncbi:MAG: substrate-binding domain-containing protein [Lachnospiraceae bacterium]|nr:substrate-binding domain-containing protein [Lachnospiraceae bacterium]
MQKKKLVMLIMLALLGVLLVSGVPLNTVDTHKQTVAVILKSNQSNFWKEFIKGLQAGAAEYNMTYFVQGPQDEEDVDAQNEMLQAAIDDQVDTIIFSAISSEDSNALLQQAKQRGIHIIMADSGVSADVEEAWIGSDNYAAGAQLAEAVSSMKVDSIKVGIVNFDRKSGNGQQREQGFREAVQADGRIEIVDAVNTASNLMASKNATIDMLKRHPEINALVTMNEWTTLGVGYAIEELNCAGSVQAYGFDSNILCIDMLEEGYLDGLIVQSPYTMGYLSIETAYRLGKKKDIGQKEIYTGTIIVTRENMYEEEIQKSIFPLTQDN